MPKRLRVVDGSREWIAELSTSGVALSNVDGSFAVSDDGDGRFHVAAASAVVTAIAAAGGGDVVWVGIDGHVFELHVRPDSGASTSAARDQDALSPPMSATVVRILVQPGARVQAGETLVVLEAMKMELPIRAPRAAAIRAVHCREGDLVQPGMALVELA
ncbi:MAG TPA: biotin/lipoyl-containing protein [Vicinamibacterales bacterium]|nr:biotin/lipoyl-containing protein [Vicinamibacterales bacterium]